MVMKKFKVQNQEALRLAFCDAVPPIMIITGPNGVGKSTLLFSIGNPKFSSFVEYDYTVRSKTLYVVPHRNWNDGFRSDIQANDLFTSITGLTSQGNGITSSSSAGEKISHRNFDNSYSFILSDLVRFEKRVDEIITFYYRKYNEVPNDYIGNIYEVFNETLSFLLPHLELIGIKKQGVNSDLIFRRTDKNDAVEISQSNLSSGERSLISIFMPFLEYQIESRVMTLENQLGLGDPTYRQYNENYQLVMIIDEPEQHLHPLLQVKVLEYMRFLSRKYNMQFILATHSPTIMNGAISDELFILTPPTNDPTYNQLVQLATNEEKLRNLRELCGGTSVLTSCKNIICIEGTVPEPGGKTATDLELLELMCPEIKANILIPSGGKEEAIKRQQHLKALVNEGIPLVSVIALVDYDQGNVQDSPDILTLPAAMIENLLLQPKLIWEHIKIYERRILLKGEDDVKNALFEICKNRRNKEIELRVSKSLKIGTPILPKGITKEEITRYLETQLEATKRKFDTFPIQDIIDKATREVEEIISTESFLRFFHGKEIIKEFIRQHLGGIITDQHDFQMRLAMMVGQDDEARREIYTTLAGFLSNNVFTSK